MAKQGKRGGYKGGKRTIVKYSTKAVGVARRAHHHAGGLAKERMPVAIAGLALGYLDARRAAAQVAPAGAAADSFGSMLVKIPAFGGFSWLATVGAGLHFYAKSHRGAKWADRGATAALTLAGYKFGLQQGGQGNIPGQGVATVQGNGPGAGANGWMPAQQAA